MSLLLGGGGGGLMRGIKIPQQDFALKRHGGGVGGGGGGGGGLAGHYGIISLTKYLPLYDNDFMKQENALPPIKNIYTSVNYLLL